MSLLEKLLSKTYVVMDSFTGNKVFRDLTKLNDDNVSFKVFTHGNFTLDIKVVKKHYVLERPGWWLFKKKDFFLYEVSCRLSDRFPNDFKEVFTHPIYIPPLLMKLVSEEKQINAVISAYLDIKIHILNQKKHHL